MEKGKLLIVDDEEAIRDQMKWAFAEDYEVFLAPDGQTALDVVEAEGPHVVALDLGFDYAASEPSDGIDILQAILAKRPETKVIVVTGSTEKEQALQAVKLGAADFYHKPIDLEELRIIVARAHHMYRLERENYELQKSLETDHRFEEMIGASPEMKEVFSQVRKASVSGAAVLIVGESGTGKELIAHALHQQSSRSEGPFVPINCAAIPSELLESELFGHEKGSFTGAHESRKGKVEIADGGTLFLDEIGDLPLSMQVKLLRFLQNKTIERVGGRESIQLDVRIISATNQDLKEAIDEGAFREDLYYRISVITIDVPPLRDRGEDIMLLANAYLRRICAEEKIPAKTLGRRAKEAMKRHPWLGNVRELENRLKRAVVMAEGRVIKPADLDLEASADGSSTAMLGTPLRKAREDLEANIIRAAVERHKGNVTKAAREVGVSRTSFYDLMRKHDIQL